MQSEYNCGEGTSTWPLFGLYWRSVLHATTDMKICNNIIDETLIRIDWHDGKRENQQPDSISQKMYMPCCG